MNDKANIEPINVLRSRLATLNIEKQQIELDLERDIEETKERLSEDISDNLYREDQNFWRNEIYKYEFCIDELERLIKLIG